MKNVFNVITLGQVKIDNSNRMITRTGDFYLVIINKWNFCNMIRFSGL